MMAEMVKASDEVLQLGNERSAFIRRFGLQDTEGVTLARAASGQPCLFGNRKALLNLANALGEVPIAPVDHQEMSSFITWMRKHLGVAS